MGAVPLAVLTGLCYPLVTGPELHRHQRIQQEGNPLFAQGCDRLLQAGPDGSAGEQSSSQSSCAGSSCWLGCVMCAACTCEAKHLSMAGQSSGWMSVHVILSSPALRISGPVVQGWEVSCAGSCSCASPVCSPDDLFLLSCLQMGPSGSGKTTLLDLLAGRKTVGKVEGAILFAGNKPTRPFLRRYTGYVEQFGEHMEMPCSLLAV